MRVLHVIARMNVGGTARYVGRLVESDPSSLLATGHVQGAEVEDDCVTRLKIVRVPHMGRKISPVNDFLAFLELRKVIRDVKPDVVHSHTFKAGLISRLVGGSFKRVHTFHGHLFDDQSFSSFDKFFITWVEKLLARKTDVLISVGERVGADLRAVGVLGRYESVPPGVDALPSMSREEARAKLGIASGVVVGWMARVTSVKNPELFFEVAKATPSVTYVMAGGGDMLEWAKENAPSNVSVIGWADASAFWSAVDVAVSTSDNEGMPVALIEAQLAGVPVVASDVGSNGEVIEDGVTGFVVPKSVEALADAVSALVGDADLRSRFGSAGRDRALRVFSVASMLGKHQEIYKSLLK